MGDDEEDEEDAYNGAQRDALPCQASGDAASLHIGVASEPPGAGPRRRRAGADEKAGRAAAALVAAVSSMLVAGVVLLVLRPWDSGGGGGAAGSGGLARAAARSAGADAGGVPVAELVEVAGTVCNDGSVAGMYVYTSGRSRSWLVQLEGGGWCDRDPADCNDLLLKKRNLRQETATKRVVDHLGADAQPSRFVSARGWNFAYLPQCSGDAFLGSGARHASARSGEAVFNGRNNLFLILAELRRAYGMADADTVLLTGLSSGGWGAAVNLEAVAALFDPAKTVVLGNNVGFTWPDRAFPAPPGYIAPVTGFSAAHLRAAAAHWGGVEVPRACAAAVGAGNEHLCLMPSYLYPTLTAPLFAHQFLVDDIFLERLLGVPIRGDEPYGGIVRRYAAGTRDLVVDAWLAAGANATGRPTHGAYLASCRSHVNFSPALRVGGVSPQDALERWVDAAAAARRDPQRTTPAAAAEHAHVDPPCGAGPSYFPTCNSCAGI